MGGKLALSQLQLVATFAVALAQSDKGNDYNGVMSRQEIQMGRFYRLVICRKPWIGVSCNFNTIIVLI